MKKSKFSEEQIVRMLKEVDAGAKVGVTCRKYDISEPTYYARKTKSAGMGVSQLRDLKEVEAELAQLKRMYADLALEHHALKDVISKALSPAQRVKLSLAMQNDHGLSARRPDRAFALSRSARYYRPRLRDDSALIEASRPM